MRILTHDQLRFWSRRVKPSGSTALPAMAKRYVGDQGPLTVLRADDSIVVFYVNKGRLRRTTYPAGSEQSQLAWATYNDRTRVYTKEPE